MNQIPKVELHCHLEGTASPALVARLAQRNGVHLPEERFSIDRGFVWADFTEFLTVYDLVSNVIRTPLDYRDVTYEYLAGCAREGAVYVEVMSSPDHAAAAGMDYVAHLDGIVQGIDDAERDHGIIGRLIVTCVRHFGPARACIVAEQVRSNLHSYVVGFGMGGDERVYSPADFAPAFNLAHEAGLACTVHAGEWAGPESVRSALQSLPVCRIGHGVRSIEDPAVLAMIVDQGIHLEVCPASNIATGIYPDYASHPLPQLREAGVSLSLNSDDPPYFASSIGREYQMASTAFEFSQDDLLQITRDALIAAFVDGTTRAYLLQKLSCELSSSETTASGLV